MKSTTVLTLTALAQAHTIFQVSTSPSPKSWHNPQTKHHHPHHHHHHHHHLTQETPTHTTHNTNPYPPPRRSTHSNSPPPPTCTPPLAGLRAPHFDYPIHNASDARLVCGPAGTHSNLTLPVRAGDRLGAWWGHVLGGEQFPGDPDHPIPGDHKGPISTYMARVDGDAATVPLEGGLLRWFKIGEEGLDTETGLWAVDGMIDAGGWVFVDVPVCLRPGQYLLRQELLALHGAAEDGGSQFYQSCAQLSVEGVGDYVPEETVSIPGAYAQDDPGVLIQIWVDGVPDNGRKPYVVPGPRPMTCPV